MNKRVKIVAASVAVKNSLKTVTGGEKLDVEASAQNICKVIEAGTILSVSTSAR